MEKVKLGIVGLGSAGPEPCPQHLLWHSARRSSPPCAAPSPRSWTRSAAEMQPQAGATTDYREMFQNKELDGVVIASNSQVHCEMAVRGGSSSASRTFTLKSRWP